MRKVRRTTSGAPGVGAFLKDVRKARGLSLRDVEKVTGGGVSNGYLSQLESGSIASPSAAMLHKLAQAYSLDYETLLSHGGLATGSEATASASGARNATDASGAESRRDVFGDLTAEEERQLLQYLAFLRR
jgi:transcriptional regulator with XRE-family HTH domain